MAQTGATPQHQALPKPSDADANKQPSGRRKPDHVLTVEAYFKDWEDDPAAARVKYRYEYKGKEVWIQITGRVWHVGNYSNNGGIVMLRREDDTSMRPQGKIGCIFESLKDCVRLPVGEKVTLCGRCFVGADTRDYPMLMSCYVVP